MKFEDWFYEQEGFHIRAERFYDDLERDSQTQTEYTISIVAWLRAAYEVGKEHGTQSHS